MSQPLSHEAQPQQSAPLIKKFPEDRLLVDRHSREYLSPVLLFHKKLTHRSYKAKKGRCDEIVF